ncbi:hypothetical protein ACJMK2_020127 [Sinanodonta woodiana]|uniref:Ephrin RBD domain-containing protein n=1 Tax=Sinanodonta woodiana TaxID=1069815 RepID=A0ABD3U0W6_SINWO
MEYYVLYMVPELYYNNCIIEDVYPPSVRLIVNCSNPTADPPISFSIWVKQFQSIPGMPDFSFLKRYYFATTSTGTPSGMNNQVHGACKNKNMSMVLEMCCNTTTTATIRQTTPIPPSTQSSTTRKPVTEKPTTLPPAPVPTTTTTTSTTSATIKTIRTTKPDFPKPDTDIVINATDENANTALIDISAARTLDTSWLVLLLTLLCQLLVLLHR